MNGAIEKRISHRSFTKEPISKEMVSRLQDWIAGANALSELNIEFLADGSEAFNGLKKSYGMFSNVGSLLLLKGSAADVNLQVKAGYYGEDLVLKITELGLGSCWVGGTYDSSQFAIPAGESLVCVIVLGYIQKSVKDQMIRAFAHSKNRKSVEQRIVSDAKVPEEIIKGMEAVRLAPSALNRQNPTLHCADGQVSMSVDLGAKFDLVDLGIAMKHFEIGAGKGKFELTNGGQWKNS